MTHHQRKSVTFCFSHRWSSYNEQSSSYRPETDSHQAPFTLGQDNLNIYIIGLLIVSCNIFVGRYNSVYNKATFISQSLYRSIKKNMIIRYWLRKKERKKERKKDKNLTSLKHLFSTKYKKVDKPDGEI